MLASVSSKGMNLGTTESQFLKKENLITLFKNYRRQDTLERKGHFSEMSVILYRILNIIITSWQRKDPICQWKICPQMKQMIAVKPGINLDPQFGSPGALVW